MFIIKYSRPTFCVLSPQEVSIPGFENTSCFIENKNVCSGIFQQGLSAAPFRAIYLHVGCDKASSMK